MVCGLWCGVLLAAGWVGEFGVYKVFFEFGLEDIVADIRILETGSNSCALGEGRIL